MLKKLLIGMAAILPMAYFTTGYAFAADSNYTVELNGTKLNATAFSEYGDLYFPLRPLSDALGYTIGWNSKNHEVTLEKKEDKIALDFDESTITEGDHRYYMSGELLNKNTAYVGENFINDTLGLSMNLDKTGKTVKLESAGKNDITIKNVNETSKEAKIDIILNYPQISGLASKTVEDKINTIIKQEAVSAKKEGLEFLKEYPDDGPENKHEAYFDYRIKYNQNNMLSIVLLDYQYLGGAHGSTTEKSYTFDLKSGKEYSMKDLFKADSNYTSYFNNFIKKDIKERDLSALTPFESIATGPAFYLENSGVSTYFQQCEYFPYAAGIPVFTVDYSALKDLLNPSLSFLNQSAKTLNAAEKNVLNVGENGDIILKGNPTTGYDWNYTIGDSSVMKLDSQTSAADSNLIGSGSTFTWHFKALKQGETKITFKYYRSWEGEKSAEQTVEYLIKVN